ncbi:hypothetical protein BDR26DRAFT_914447 [Obelidium mucronatum]|nr:hypothetical protein BDR26DRAFT_914447 [Obelidium mucronatum]
MLPSSSTFVQSSRRVAAADGLMTSDSMYPFVSKITASGSLLPQLHDASWMESTNHAPQLRGTQNAWRLCLIL